jgi:LemA protein
MKGIGAALLVVIGLAVVGGIWLVSSRNGMVEREEGVREAWSQVENAYQRRSDLIPNLVETVKGVAGFEKDTYTAVAEARAKAGEVKVSGDLLADPQKFKQFEEAQRELGTQLSRLLVSVERYPDLKASTSFRDLMTQLEGTENRISVERRRFNEAVREYNLVTRRFPGSLIAGVFGFREKPYFEADKGAATAPKVSF